MPMERAVRLAWSGTGMQFTGGGTMPTSPDIVVDGDGAAGPSPMQTLLLAAAGCAGSDVVSIFRKMRVTLQSMVVDVVGIRRDEEPRRYVAITFRFAMRGEGLDPAKAERAVMLSLAPDIAVRHEITLA
jgi:uncharacterized OsmC-like protein